MNLKILAAIVTAAALPVLAQTPTTAPVEPRQARVEVSDPAGGTATAPKKASKPAKSSKSAKSAKTAKTTKKTSKKKAAGKPQAAG